MLLAPDAALSAVVALAPDAPVFVDAVVCVEADAAAVGDAADAADAAAVPVAPPAAFERSVPGGNGGTDVPRPASGAKSIAFLRNGRCGSRTISTFVCCLACE